MKVTCSALYESISIVAEDSFDSVALEYLRSKYGTKGYFGARFSSDRIVFDMEFITGMQEVHDALKSAEDGGDFCMWLCERWGIDPSAKGGS